MIEASMSEVVPRGEGLGVTVTQWASAVLCNGLGTNPYAWPALLDPECGVRVVSWNHRGTGGSDRPADPSHVEIQHFVQDALSVMDHFGVGQAVVVGWSMGVNTMFELAVHHPERVKGLFAVAGVPGDTFATMLGPMFVPRFVARTLTVGLSTVLKYAGKAITPVSTRLPVGQRAIAVISPSGRMFPMADKELAVRAVKEFLTTGLTPSFGPLTVDLLILKFSLGPVLIDVSLLSLVGVLVAYLIARSLF